MAKEANAPTPGEPAATTTAPAAPPAALAAGAAPKALKDDRGGRRPSLVSALEESPVAEAKKMARPTPMPAASAAAAPALAATMAPRVERDDAPRDGAALRATLNPNARYATTYRPGGAMLAAFDAAVARGALPASYRELVADFGARYAPAMPAPTGQALSVRVDAERAAVAPAGGFMHLRVALRSADESPGRSPLSVHLVLDVSGSMEGAPIANAKAAAKSLVARLAPTDVVSITTFSSDAQVLVPAGTVGTRRGFITAAIDGIAATGGTNISAGLDRGYAEARRTEASLQATKIVMLLSDGMANAGDTNLSSLAARGAEALGDGIQTSTFGVGDSFDAQLMAKVADRGAGGYYYLKDSAQIAGALATELDARLMPVAQAVEVRLRLKPGVTPVRVYGSEELRGEEAAAVRAQEVTIDKLAAKKSGIALDRKEDAEGGMRFFMPAFARADRHAMLVELAVPAGVGDKNIASVEIRYKDVLRKKNVTEEIAVKTRYADSAEASAKTTDASVVATMQAFSAGDAILRASELTAQGQRERAATMLRERAELLMRAKSSLQEERLADDAARLARLASITGGETKLDPLPLAVLLRGSAYGYLR